MNRVIEVTHWSAGSFVTIGTPFNHKRPDDWFCRYTVGKEPRRYQLPAIRQHFEFGWQLGHGPVLLHCVQGPYED